VDPPSDLEQDRAIPMAGPRELEPDLEGVDLHGAVHERERAA
jgi:hypothetical protein